MKELVALWSTVVFLVATLGLMLHAAAAVLGHAPLTWMLAWVAPIGLSSIVMALLDVETPLSERRRG